MTTLSIPRSHAEQGVRIATNKLTTVQVQTASFELLVGSPYADHAYGHTALRVITKTEERIYDYGRYGRTWGVGKSEGDGVLNVWNSFDSYIAEENSLGRTTTGFLYETAEERVQKIIEFYDAKIAGKKPTSTTKQKKAYVIDDYYALGPNCTTLSVSAAKVAIPEIDREWSTYQRGRGLSLMERALVSAKGWPNALFMPADLQALLESSSGRKAKAVKIYGAKK